MQQMASISKLAQSFSETQSIGCSPASVRHYIPASKWVQHAKVLRKNVSFQITPTTTNRWSEVALHSVIVISIVSGTCVVRPNATDFVLEKWPTFVTLLHWVSKVFKL